MRSFLAPVQSVTQSTPRTRIIVADLSGEQPFAFHAGQAVFAGLAEGTVRRPYSIACSPAQARRDRAIELLVQIDDHRAPDPHLERAAPGTLLRIEGPFGSFNLPSPLRERHLLLVAGGTGIAPLRSMMWDVLEHQPEVRIAIIYSARAPGEFAYWNELSALAVDGRIRLAATVTRERPGAWEGATGRIDQSLLAAMLETGETRCVVCGPQGFVAGVTAIVRSAGVDGERIQTETYAA